MSIEKEKFIDRHKQAIINACSGTGLFPSIVMAQMILESGIGKSTLSLKYNNFFGIKAYGGWTGKTVRMRTPHDSTPTSLFRVYDSPQESIEDHNKFLKGKRYVEAGVFSANTWEKQLQAIADAGYAEDRLYTQKISAEIRRYRLYDLDVLQSRSNQITQAGFGDLGIVLIALFLIGRYFFRNRIK